MPLISRIYSETATLPFRFQMEAISLELQEAFWYLVKGNSLPGNQESPSPAERCVGTAPHLPLIAGTTEGPRGQAVERDRLPIERPPGPCSHGRSCSSHLI